MRSAISLPSGVVEGVGDGGGVPVVGVVAEAAAGEAKGGAGFLVGG